MIQNVNKIIGRNIRNLRKSSKITASSLAAELCISEKTVEAYESGKIRCSAEMLFSIRQVFCRRGKNIPIEYFYGGLIMRDTIIKAIEYCYLDDKNIPTDEFIQVIYALKADEKTPGMLAPKIIGSVAGLTISGGKNSDPDYSITTLLTQEETIKSITTHKENGKHLSLLMGYDGEECETSEILVTNEQCTQILDFFTKNKNKTLSVYGAIYDEKYYIPSFKAYVEMDCKMLGDDTKNELYSEIIARDEFIFNYTIPTEQVDPLITAIQQNSKAKIEKILKTKLVMP